MHCVIIQVCNRAPAFVMCARFGTGPDIYARPPRDLGATLSIFERHLCRQGAQGKSL
jgi:hypothetical protein